MSVLRDLSGQKFGRLSGMWPVGFGLVGTQKKTFWLFWCECGKLHISTMGNVTGGISKSCGCLNSERIISFHWKHGHSKVGFQTTEYNTWASMLSRCRNPNNSDWKNYGGRGIRVCEHWNEFANFFKDMGFKPSPELTIERKNNDGNYEPSNCCWATRKEQRRNQRPYKGGHRCL